MSMLKGLKTYYFNRNNIIILLMGAFLVIPFNLLINNSSYILLISDCLISWVIVSFVFTLFSFNKHVLSFIFSIFVILNASFFYMNYFLNVDINLNIIMAISQTDTREALEHTTAVSFNIIPYIILAVILPVYLGFKYKLKRKNFLVNIKEKLGLLIIFIIFILVSLFTNLNKIEQDNDPKGIRYLYLLFNINIQQFPINWVYNSVKYFTVSSGNFTFSKIPENNKFSVIKKDKPYNIVFVIGETARADRFSLGGYERKTNPLLEKRKNLVYFNNFYSCNTGTIFSVSCLFGFKSGKDFRANIQKNLHKNVESFIPIFNNTNFDTYLASSNSYKPRDPMFQRVKEAKSITYLPHSLGNKDEDMIPLLQKILSKQNKNKPNKLIILHTMGSHFKYAARYPESFKKWNPICSSLIDRNIKDCNKEYLNNEYDNTILYTDYVLNGLMNVLNKTNTILIYASDHGESLGEKGKYYHGSSFNTAPVTQIHIPAMIWFSEGWIKNFGKKELQNAQSKKNALLNHDFISFSVLDCAFIQSKFIDKSLSLCSSVPPKKISIK